MTPIAALPDPSDPTIVPFSAALIAFAATLVAHLRGHSREERQDAAFEGAFLGTGVGLAFYLGSLLAGLT